MKRKKLRFQYCTALFATTLLVGTNCAVATASEPENIETRAPAFMEDAARNAMNDAEELKVSESPPNKIAKTKDTIPDNKNPIENLSETLLKNMPAKPDRMLSDSGEIPAEIPAKTKYTPPNGENPAKDASFETEHMNFDSEKPIESTPAEPESTLPSENSPESTLPSSENPTEDTSAEPESTPPSSEDPTEGNSTEPEGTDSDCENTIEDNSSPPVDSILDSEHTIPENTLPDLEETKALIDVNTICAKIDTLPTVDQLYADASGVDNAGYEAWQSEMQELHRQILELQEQYHLLTTEEQALVGDARKAKLEALGMLLEEGALLNIEGIFTDENGISYRIIEESDSNNKVRVVSSGKYSVTLTGIVTIPPSVTFKDNGIEYEVAEIGELAFNDCDQLTEIIITNSVQSIGNSAFHNCIALTSITIPNDILISELCFEKCTQLSTMKIIVAGDTPVPASVEDANAFQSCPAERQIIFQTPDGTELSNTTTPSLASVVNIYKAVDDGNKDDYFWYGWKLKAPTYIVTVNVLKDSNLWQDHDRTFALKSTDSDEFITDLNDVKNGDYLLYDITNTSTPAEGLDTKIPVEVKDGNITSNPVEYYTVSFYDHDTLYDTDTPQAPQIILKDNIAAKPADPVKDGYIFEKWVKENDATTEFDFNSPIASQTNVYASWKSEYKPGAYKVTIEVYLDGKKWTENCTKTFALKATDSGKLTSNLSAVAEGQYDIYEISAGEIDTNVDVTISGADASARIDYYTVQFVDENVPYGNDTPQKPQIILKEQHASEPEAPTKEGFIFAGWKEILESDVLYDFENITITNTINLYAAWTPADSGGKPGDEENKPGDGDGENKPGDGDNQQPGDGENKPDDGEQPPGGDDQKPGDGENKPDDGEQPPGSGDDENKPGDGEQPPGGGDGENKPGDGEQPPGDGDNQQPGDGEQPPGGDDQKPGDGENKPGDGEQPPDEGENKPGNGDDQKPGDGENKPGGGDNQKPDNGNDQKPDNNENKPDNGNQQPPEKDSGQNLNKTAPYSMDTSVNTSTFMVTQTTALPSEENAINSSIPNEVITDYSSTSPVKDKEPQTGDESSTGIYSIVAILASIVLALLHFAEHADIKELLQSINAKHKYPDKRQRASISFIIHKKLNVQSSKKKDRTLNGIWTRRKQYYFLSG